MIDKLLNKFSVLKPDALKVNCEKKVDHSVTKVLTGSLRWLIIARTRLRANKKSKQKLSGSLHHNWCYLKQIDSRLCKACLNCYEIHFVVELYQHFKTRCNVNIIVLVLVSITVFLLLRCIKSPETGSVFLITLLAIHK